MDSKMLELLVCPQCKGKLTFDHSKQELICRFDKLAYPIKDDVPVMIVDEARQLTLEEL